MIIKDEVGDIDQITEIGIEIKVTGNLPKSFKYLEADVIISFAFQKLRRSVDLILDCGTTSGIKANEIFYCSAYELYYGFVSGPWNRCQEEFWVIW